MDTIAAIATGLGEAGIAIVRVSGPDSLNIAARIFRPSRRGQSLATAPSHLLLHGWVHDPLTQEPVDEVLAVAMLGGRSYTGELTVELQGHGGAQVSRQVLQAVLAAGARMAEPGEFSRRAFVNGKLDLAQAEAVIDLIQAKTARAARVAASGVRGELSAAVRQVRERLLEFQAHAEALMDFPELDLDAHDLDMLTAIVTAAEGEVERLLRSSREGRVLREGFRVALVGQTNAGKSSLFNRLLGSERAIVTAVAGTTRDVLEEWISLDGYPFLLVDTAGIRETGDVVEQIGVERSRQEIERADLVLVLIDGTRPLQPEDQEILAAVADLPHLVVRTKLDALPAGERGEGLYVSAHSGAGLDDLRRVLVEAAAGAASEREGVVVTNARHEAALRAAGESLRGAAQTLAQNVGLDLASMEVRGAWESLGLVVGETAGDDLLDQIFSRFCIGK